MTEILGAHAADQLYAACARSRLRELPKMDVREIEAFSAVTHFGYDANLLIDYVMKMYYRFAIVAHEGRLRRRSSRRSGEWRRPRR